MEIYQTVAGNNSPDLPITVKRNGTVIDVTGCTVTLAVTKERTGDLTTNITCALTTPASGIVTFSPTASTFPVAGRYIGELKVVFTNNAIERIKERILIIADQPTT